MPTELSRRPYIPKSAEAGFTLIEMMVGVGLAGIIFFIAMSLMGTSGNLVSIFYNTASTIEAVSDAVSELNTIMPGVVKVTSCGCRADNSTTLSNCLWYESTPWYDPMKDGTASSSPITIFVGEYESYIGATWSGSTNSFNNPNTTQLLRSAITAPNGGCNSYGDATLTTNNRGCKQTIKLQYSPPVIESGTTPSTAGKLSFVISANGATGNTVNIGNTVRNGAYGIGVTELSCGFYQSSVANTSFGSGQTGLNFVLNFKIKARTTTTQSVSDNLYESWHPNGKNYGKGSVREIRLKYSFLNLQNRGLYQWKTFSKRNCLPNGTTVTGAGGSTAAEQKEVCCSLAVNAGGACEACHPSGTSGTSANCCSEQASSGTCI